MGKFSKQPYLVSVARESNFVMIKNEVFHADWLTGSEKLFFGLLASLPEGIELVQSEMAAKTGLSERTIKRLVKSLEAKKILIVTRGKFNSNDYTLTDSKDWMRSGVVGQVVTTDGDMGVTNEGVTSGTSPYNKYLLNKYISHAGESEIKGEATARVEYKFDFEAAYQLYPKKVGKKKAFEKLAKTIRTQERYDLFVLVLKKYVRFCEEQNRYLKDFSAFANQWENYEDLPGGQGEECKIEF